MWVFNLLPPWFQDLAVFIWWPAVTFIASLILLAILRMWVSFVFKLFKLSIDYKTMTNKKWW